MLLHEICSRCGVTRKAVEYYIRQGLITPRTGDNRYRDFTEDDEARLRKIIVLRRLGLSVGDIGAVLSGENTGKILARSMDEIKRRTELLQAQRDCMAHLLGNECDLEASAAYIDMRLTGSRIIADRLQEAFPGSYGDFLSLHFGRFLQGSVDSPEKARAFDTVMDFLDAMEDTGFPPEVEEFLEEAVGQDSMDHEEMSKALTGAANDFDGFMDQYGDHLEWYWQYRRSDAFRQSPAYILGQRLVQIQRQNGYYDVFLPAMMTLSPSYRAYRDQMEEANRRLLERYPQLADLYPAK